MAKVPLVGPKLYKFIKIHESCLVSERFVFFSQFQVFLNKILKKFDSAHFSSYNFTRWDLNVKYVWQQLLYKILGRH